MKACLQLVLLISLLYVFPALGEKPVVMDLVWLPDSAQNNMVCNDGSPYGYYFRPMDPTRWVIHFQGGGWCYDEGSCASRFNLTNPMMSSKTWKTRWAASGLFDQNPSDNPDWYNATFVYLPYCTSDSFSGNATASAATFGWSFFGKNVLTGAINHLLATTDLGSAPEVLLSGCSAGGAAVVANVDYVASLLPPMSGRNFRGHVDAGWFMWAHTFVPKPITMQGMMITGATLWNGQPNPKCVEAYPDSIGQCYMGQFAHPYFTVPVLVHQEGEDFVQLTDVNGLPYPWGEKGTFYEASWRANLTQSLMELKNPNYVAFSPACSWHCVTEDTDFWEIGIKSPEYGPGGFSDRDALHEFFFNGNASTTIDPCTTFSCSIGCPKAPVQSEELKSMPLSGKPASIVRGG